MDIQSLNKTECAADIVERLRVIAMLEIFNIAGAEEVTFNVPAQLFRDAATEIEMLRCENSLLRHQVKKMTN